MSTTRGKMQARALWTSAPRSATPPLPRRLRSIARVVRYLRPVIALGLVAVLVGACGSEGASQSGAGTSTGSQNALNVKQTGPGLTEPTVGSGNKIHGGTVTYAEAPGAPPNYISPMFSTEYCSINFGALQNLLYRPLYWYGNNNSPNIDYDYSIGKTPVFSNGGKTITIHLKHWMWSNGEQVTARDLVFWMNVLDTDPDRNWCASTPGGFPFNVTSYKAVNPTTFQMTLDRAYSHTWIIYNELSSLTPMPMAWDRTSLSQPAPKPNAPNLPDTTKAGANAVWKFLNAQSLQLQSWSTSPIWSVVDGPWKLESTTSNGGLTFVPNKAYSGSPKPTLQRVVEVPFTSGSSEVNVLRGGGPSALSIAYLPGEDQPLKSTFEKEGYTLNMGSTFTSSFMSLNLNAPKVGVIFRQLYARQALEHLVDQSGWISKFLHGAAVPSYGPVPLAPPDQLGSGVSETDEYPFSDSAAARLLRANGWKVVPGGQSICIKPGTGAGECGAGVAKGQPFAFTVSYESGVTAVSEEMLDWQSQASTVGIKISLASHPYTDVADSNVHCAKGQPDCDWVASNYGYGWGFGPGDYYPSGNSLYDSTSNDNMANYSDAKMDRLAMATVYAKPSMQRATMAAFVKYTEQQVPYIWMPETVGAAGGDYAGTLVDNKLGGYAWNAFGYLTPEAWYLTK